MNYSKLYYKLIDSRRQLNRTKSSENFFELHHVLPKSLGGTNQKSNLVLLTPKEHFVAHHLLYKMHSGRDKAKMAYALFRMCSNNPLQHRVISARAFEYAKSQISRACSGENHPAYKINPFTEEQLLAQSRRMQGSNNPMYGKSPHNKGKKGNKLSTETKQKMSETRKGKPDLSFICPHCNKEGKSSAMFRWHFDNCKFKRLSTETKQKMSETRKGKPDLSFICPHCNKEGKSSAMFRWHFDNCKLRPGTN